MIDRIKLSLTPRREEKIIGRQKNKDQPREITHMLKLMILSQHEVKSKHQDLLYVI